MHAGGVGRQPSAAAAAASLASPEGARRPPARGARPSAPAAPGPRRVHALQGRGGLAVAAAAPASAQGQRQPAADLVEERGVHFTPGQAFYRAESAQGRDLAVLAAAVHRRQAGRLHVLDAMAGSGMRGARYLLQADADLVWGNDLDTRNLAALAYNLAGPLLQEPGQQRGAGGVAGEAAALLSSARRLEYPGLRGDVLEWERGGRRCRISSVEANRLLCATYLQEQFFDLVDVDSFGSDTSHLPAAIDAVRFGGLLYLTSTDGFCSGGKRPARSVAAYGSYLRALPHANEQGLRMLVGAAVREGAARGVQLAPLFSLYSYHGPVFRVMMRATRGNLGLRLQDYGFVGHCHVHGESRRVGWRALSQAWCRCRPPAGTQGGGGGQGGGAKGSAPTPMVLSGPMWTGPLHDEAFVSAMAELAAEWGWAGGAVPAGSPYVVRQSKNNRQRPLEVLLELMRQEAHPALPPWYLRVDTLAQHLDTTPSRDRLVQALRARGFVACLCHVENRALRTNATTAEVLEVAVQDCGYRYRPTPSTPAVLLQQQQVHDRLDEDGSEGGDSGDSGSSSSSSNDSSGDSSGGSSSSSSSSSSSGGGGPAEAPGPQAGSAAAAAAAAVAAAAWLGAMAGPLDAVAASSSSCAATAAVSSECAAAAAEQAGGGGGALASVQQGMSAPQLLAAAPAAVPARSSPGGGHGPAAPLITPESMWLPLALSTLAGLSTGIGALIAVSVPPSESTLAFLLGTAIGVMATVSLVELWVHSAVEQQDAPGVTAAVGAGAALFALADALLPRPPEPGELAAAAAAAAAALPGGERGGEGAQALLASGATSELGASNPERSGGSGSSSSSSAGSGGSNTGRSSSGGGGSLSQAGGATTAAAAAAAPAASRKPGDPGGAHSAGLMRLGMLMALTLSLHNLPEGFAVAFSAYTPLGPTMALAIALHNIPEGLVISAPIYAATGSRAAAAGLAVASGLSEPLGAAAALLAARPFVSGLGQLDYVLAATGGVMLAVCALELLPEARRCGRDGAAAAGAALGAAVMGWTLHVGA